MMEGFMNGHVDDELISAAGASCPMPGCDAVAISYRTSAGPQRTSGLNTDYEFLCPRCGAVFFAFGSGLIFDSVPRDWLLASISNA